ncbi:hypothetical protein BHE74_00048627 [Ensete ventricosum]|nr:hypothetical protein GW17_00043797 [Ensete ventricosum]RWW45521.1 hypothetical protein BHE74_00048627 [Ensete ventricosum]RZS18485.1 hypothetical protein BHM03_00050753 [Ensete ventricosum]
MINFAQSLVQSRVSIIFCAPNRNFKIHVIPNVLVHGKSYKHDFTKKCDGHKFCTKS